MLTDPFLMLVIGILLGCIPHYLDTFISEYAQRQAAKRIGKLPELIAVNKSISQMYQSQISEFRTIATLVDGADFKTQQLIIRIIDLLSKARL